MTASESNMKSIMAEADRLGEEQAKIDERNRKRRAKGRKPLPDLSDKKDKEVLMKKYRTDDPTTVDGADALKLFELRKAAMSKGSDVDDDEDDEDSPETPRMPVAGGTFRDPRTIEEEKAIREAAAVRRVQDMKNGRIDHDGNWSKEGQRLEGGDKTEMVSNADVRRIVGKTWEIPLGADTDPSVLVAPTTTPRSESPVLNPAAIPLTLEALRDDLYERLRQSFDALEGTLSDLQGRVAEIVTASMQSLPHPVQEEEPEEKPQDEFELLLAQKTPVSFDVGGTKMTFDAITVFHAPPCITVVSKIGSAKITPKPGARLLLSYAMDGASYENDPVTYLGTRFDLPMFGLSFVGFIRDLEADVMDADAGVE